MLFQFRTLMAALLWSSCLMHHVATVYADDSNIKTMPDSKNGVIRGKHGNYRIFYDSDKSADSCCNTVVVINVGTAMSATDYDDLATETAAVAAETVVVIGDNNPFNGVKTSDKKFVKMVEEINSELPNKLGTCCQKSPKNGFVVGGHSAGGQASAMAIQKHTTDNGDCYFNNVTKVVGYVGLSPYDASKVKSISTPSLNWGFGKMTCGVPPESAAIAAYDASSPDQRVFYQYENENGGLTSGPHCSYTDGGCVFMCKGTDETREFIHDVVPKSIATFVKSILRHSIRRSDFQHLLDNTSEEQVKLFVNQESVSAASAATA